MIDSSFDVDGSWFVVCGLLCVDCCLLSADRWQRLLIIVRGVLFVVCCVFSVLY